MHVVTRWIASQPTMVLRPQTSRPRKSTKMSISRETYVACSTYLFEATFGTLVKFQIFEVSIFPSAKYITPIYCMTIRA